MYLFRKRPELALTLTIVEVESCERQEDKLDSKLPDQFLNTKEKPQCFEEISCLESKLLYLQSNKLWLDPIIRLWRSAADDDFIFMHDNAPPHTRRASKEILETQGVTLLDWTACSPDLNPIKNLWDQVKRRIRICQDHLGNMRQFQDRFKQHWLNGTKYFWTVLKI